MRFFYVLLNVHFDIFVKETKIDARFILSIFRQTLHVSGLSMAHYQEVQPYVYNNWYLLFFLDDCLLSWLEPNQDIRQKKYTENKLCIKLVFLYKSNVIACIVSVSLCGTWGFLQYTPPAGLPEDGGSRFTEMSVLIFDNMTGHPRTFLLWIHFFIYKYIYNIPLTSGAFTTRHEPNGKPAGEIWLKDISYIPWWLRWGI